MDDLNFDEKMLRRAILLSKLARNSGHGAFGAVLVRGSTVVFEAENTVSTDLGDKTCHAEMNLLRQASTYFNGDMSDCTMYCSTEPCPMCAGAAYASRVGRIVYGVPSELYAEKFGGLGMGCREVFQRDPDCRIEVVGPLLLEEAMAVHEG